MVDPKRTLAAASSPPLAIGSMKVLGEELPNSKAGIGGRDSGLRPPAPRPIETAFSIGIDARLYSDLTLVNDPKGPTLNHTAA